MTYNYMVAYLWFSDYCATFSTFMILPPIVPPFTSPNCCFLYWSCSCAGTQFAAVCFLPSCLRLHFQTGIYWTAMNNRNTLPRRLKDDYTPMEYLNHQPIPSWAEIPPPSVPPRSSVPEILPRTHLPLPPPPTTSSRPRILPRTRFPYPPPPTTSRTNSTQTERFNENLDRPNGIEITIFILVVLLLLCVLLLCSISFIVLNDSIRHVHYLVEGLGRN